MTEMMKRYEAETDELATWRWHDKEFVTDDYIAWLESQLTWQPVSEKPKEGQIVFAMIPTGWVVAQYLHGEFYVDDGFTFGDIISGVNNWLPIPPVPEGTKGITELKKASLDIASRMFPTHIDTIKKQKDGDGILIAEYARLKNL